MRYQNLCIHAFAGGSLLATLALGIADTGVAQEHPSRIKRFLTKPLVIEDQGSFFVGGVAKVTDYAWSPAPPDQRFIPNQIIIGQMYVQFQIPERKKSNMPPVIMVHGSSHTGASLESTPDGREGWLPYFVRNGISTYVVDQSGRGRSGFDHSTINEAAGLIRAGDVAKGTASLPVISTITDDLAWKSWFGHLIPSGSSILTGTLIRHGDPGDPPGDDATHADTYHPAFALAAVDSSLVSRAGAIGPRPAGPNDYFALEYYKQLVPNTEVTLPGSTCASCNPTALTAAETWTPQNLATLVERLGGAVVMTHSQSGIMGLHTARILKERGHLDLLKGLISIEGDCNLAKSGLTVEDFDNIPYLVLKGDYTNVFQGCQTLVVALNARRSAGQGAAQAEFIKLDELGNLVFNGTTHMMMAGSNNLEIADVILRWADQHIPAKNKNRKDRD
jgi:hypothetical protein